MVNTIYLGLIQSLASNLFIISAHGSFMWSALLTWRRAKLATLETSKLSIHLTIRSVTLPLEVLLGLDCAGTTLSEGASSDGFWFATHRGCAIPMQVLIRRVIVG